MIRDENMKNGDRGQCSNCIRVLDWTEMYSHNICCECYEKEQARKAERARREFEQSVKWKNLLYYLTEDNRHAR